MWNDFPLIDLSQGRGHAEVCLHHHLRGVPESGDSKGERNSLVPPTTFISSRWSKLPRGEEPLKPTNTVRKIHQTVFNKNSIVKSKSRKLSEKTASPLPAFKPT